MPNSQSKTRGVFRWTQRREGCKPNPIWRASLTVLGKRRTRDFSVVEHGERRARALARAQRKSWEMQAAEGKW